MWDQFFWGAREGHRGFGAHWELGDEHPARSATGWVRFYAHDDGWFEKRGTTVRKFALQEQANTFTLLNIFNDLQLADQDASPVAARRFRTIDGLIRAADTSNIEGRHISKASIEQLAIADLSNGADVIRRDGSVAFTANQSLGGFRLTNVQDPSAAQDAATKAYVDAIASGLDLKASVRVATTANVNLANALENGDSIDGVTLVTGNRVLVKNQTAPEENGIYIVPASGAAGRSTDADVSAEVTAGMFTFVSEGTVNGNTGWVLITDDPITLGSTGLTFTQFSAATSIDHGSLTGLGDDDHTQYILVSGGRAFSGDQSMGGNKLTNVDDPASAQDAATKAYVDASAADGAVTIVKSADESIDNSAVLQDDDELQFPMLANTTYKVTLIVFFAAGATPDFKYRVEGPTAPTLVLRDIRMKAPGSAAIATAAVSSGFDGSDRNIAGAAGHGCIQEEITVQNGANAGDFKFRFAQQSATTSDPVIVYGGSSITYKAA